MSGNAQVQPAQSTWSLASVVRFLGIKPTHVGVLLCQKVSKREHLSRTHLEAFIGLTMVRAIGRPDLNIAAAAYREAKRCNRRDHQAARHIAKISARLKSKARISSPTFGRSRVRIRHTRLQHRKTALHEETKDLDSESRALAPVKQVVASHQSAQEDLAWTRGAFRLDRTQSALNREESSKALGSTAGLRAMTWSVCFVRFFLTSHPDSGAMAKARVHGIHETTLVLSWKPNKRTLTSCFVPQTVQWRPIVTSRLAWQKESACTPRTERS